LQPNTANTAAALLFLREVIHWRLREHFQQQEADASGHPELSIGQDGSLLTETMIHYRLGFEECMLLLMALYPHVEPNLLDQTIQEFLPQGGDFPEIGGIKGTNHRGTLPTGETALFIIAGKDLDRRLQLQVLLQESSALVRDRILWLEPVREGEPLMSGRLVLSPDWLHKFLTGVEPPPKFGPDFPAKLVSTEMGWEDLVLDAYTQSQIDEIRIWLRHSPTLLQDELMKKKLKPGYRVLFHGPAGTGKTLTAALLGRQFDKEVYKIDLSQVVSKYIGETEKNLENIFSRAERKDWILFFDEADALFGKRTQVQSSHDRYANQEVSYLLQRVEDYPGLLILASNFKNNIDEAFLRRFHSIVYFPLPGAAERLDLWKKAFPASLQPAPGLDLRMISDKYELTGAAILNIVHYAALQTLAKGERCIALQDLQEGINKEYRKENKTAG
jgi:ATPase family associated with various cellular activities (AAA)